jgi:hypothetical protein
MAQWIEDPQGRPEVEKVTKELKLPVWKANYKGKFRDFWNELWDKIEDYCLKLKEGSKKTDDRLNSAIGRNDGDFPIANAAVGNVYYSELTKKYYKCKVGGPAPMPNGNFVDMSILENLNRLENLYTTKEEKTKLSLTQINTVNLNNIRKAGFYVSSGWGNNISGLPQELSNNDSRAFYLVVFSLESGSYCQQILYSFKGLIFYRAITDSNSLFGQWRKINLI